ncbi:MAG: DedA family protein [Deltaproteobacteria bacterium]|nr:MAG: DedA family protein [Deltaproteobacteria bacterium]
MVEFVLRTAGSYPLLFLFCATAGIVPVPEDLPALVAGMASAEGHANLLVSMVVAFTGVMLRDVMFYGLGRGLSAKVLDRPGVRRFIGGAKVDRARDLVRNRGVHAVLIGRFLVGFRTPVFLAAGALGVPFGQFLLWDVLGGIVMVPGMVLLGFYFGEPALHALQWVLAHSGWVAAAAVVALGLWWVLRRPEPAVE